MVTRRDFLKVMGGAAVLGSSFYCLDDTTDKLVTEYLTVRIPNLPKDFEDYRISFLTDLHMGPLIKEGLLENALNRIKNEKTDLLVLGGDYVGLPDNAIARAFVPKVSPNFNYLNPEYTESLFAPFHKQIKEFNLKNGIFGVLGNHDRWSIEGVCQKAMNTSWSSLLVNQETEIVRGKSKLKLLGVDDFWTGVPKIPRGLTLNKNEFRVLVAHNPDYVAYLDNNPDKCKVDFALSGHTHGGQIRLGIFGSVVSNINDKRLTKGLIPLNNFPVYVSRGLGVVELPYRVNCTPEVTIITLKSM